MSLSFTQEQDELRAAVRRFVAERSPSSVIRRLMAEPVGLERSVWQTMAEQLGLLGLGIPECYGGSGGGMVELGIVMEELGRGLAVSPFYSSVVLGAQTLIASGDTAAQENWLPGIASGEIKATAAFGEQLDSSNSCTATVRAERQAGDWVLTGTKMFVPEGLTADVLFVVAATDRGPGVFAVTADSPGLKRRELKALDMTRRLACVEFQGVPAAQLGTLGNTAMLCTIFDVAVAALAVEQVGGAQRCLDMAVEYAKARIQFDRPIGSFQAIKHMCADVLLEVESARSAAYFAVSIAGTDDPEASIASSLAKVYCSEAFTHAAKTNIQVHGGIGFTWEHDAHLYLRRAKSSELMLGSPDLHRDRLAALVGIGEEVR